MNMLGATKYTVNTTCALAASIGSACADATASIISNMGAADGTVGDATGIVLDAAAAPGGDCTTPAFGLPAATATGDSLLEPVGSTTMEGVERGTADQSGRRILLLTPRLLQRRWYPVFIEAKE
jgi:hypothetical protein